MSRDEILRELKERCRRLEKAGETRLPSERALAEELGVTRSRVRSAIAVLARDGVVTVLRGRSGGAYLASARSAAGDHCARTLGMFAVISPDGRSIKRGLNGVAGVPRSLIRQKGRVDSRVLSAALEACDAQVAGLLEVEPGDLTVSLLRLRFAGAAPLSLERMYLSYERFPHLLDEGLQGVGSMYELLGKRYGVVVASAEEELEVGAASLEAAHLLGIRAGDPVLALRRRAWDGEGRPVECSFDVFRGDRTRLTIHTPTSGHSVGGPEGRLVARETQRQPKRDRGAVARRLGERAPVTGMT